MSEPGRPVRGILVSHGAMAGGIVDAVERITGVAGGALEAISNQGVAPEVLTEEIRRRLAAGPAILFTDLQSGSCGVAARRAAESHGTVVITGVNLPMLLDFVLSRDLPLVELVPRLLQRGRAAIGCAPADFADRDADRPAPR